MLIFIYGVCMVTLFLILWVTLTPASQYKKGWLFTVKITDEQYQNDDVQLIVRQYRRNIYIYMLVSILLFIPLVFIKNLISIQLMYFFIIFLLITFFCETPYMYAHVQLKKLKANKQWYVNNNAINRPEDDEFNWRWGVYYVNKDDRRFMVDKKLGIGMTLNYGLPYAKQYIIGTLMILFLVILGSIAPLCLLEMSEPKIEWVNPGEVKINYYQYSSGFYYSDINKLTLIEEIPNAYKINGMSTSTVMRGYFKLKGIGKGMAYVNLRTPPYLLIETNGGYFLLNKQDKEETLALYEQIVSQKENEYVTSFIVTNNQNQSMNINLDHFDINQALNQAVEIKRKEQTFNSQYKLDLTYHLRSPLTIELAFIDDVAVFRYAKDPKTLYQLTDEDNMVMKALLR